MSLATRTGAPCLRLEVTLGGELLVGRGHDAAGDAELRGERTARGQPCAGRQAAVADRGAQRPLELLVHRLLVVAVELDEHVNWPCVAAHELELYAGPDSAYGASAMSEITVIGGGLAGLTAAITGAEAGAEVRLFEAHEELGGRARSTEGPYKANLGPHAIYAGGVLWEWLHDARTDAAAGPAAR